MDNLKSFRAALQRKNRRRFNYVKAQFEKSDAQQQKLTKNDEVQGLMNIEKIVQHEPVDKTVRQKQIAISSSDREVWYRDALKMWLGQHPEAGVAVDNNAGLYRFALEFFVNQVVLRPKNNTLSYGELLNYMQTLNEPDPILADINFQLETKLEDLKEITSFISAMEYLENMQVFGPMRQIDELIQTDMHSEFDETSQYAADYAAYQKLRKRDLLNKRQRHDDEGLEFKH